MRTPYSELTEEQRNAKRASVRRYHAKNREKVKSIKAAYELTDAGKASKKRCELNYIATGGRAKSELKRASKPLSTARKAAKVQYQFKKRAGYAELTAFDKFVIAEANSLARLREVTTNIKSWHIDHIVPVSKGGSSHYYNLQVVPASWNRSKSNNHTNKFIGA
jgi:hypothetical protein